MAERPAQGNGWRHGISAFAGAACLLLLCSLPAFALSEIQREELPPPATSQSESETPAPAEPAPAAPSVPAATPQPPISEPVQAVPLPDPLKTIPDQPADTQEAEPETNPNQAAPDAPGRAGVNDDIPVPEVSYDLDALPVPVRRMRELIIEACKTGDIEKLRPLIGSGPAITTLSFGAMESDPIEFLRGTSGDTDGQEILAILLEVLEAGYVRTDPGTDAELFVWPYFFAMPLANLTPQQKVELFKLVTAGDYEDMQSFGAYIFYRVGISPDGRWSFFVAGD